MTVDFSISADWISSNNDSPEIRETSAFLTIQLGDYFATRADDDWSKSVRTNVRVSAYPLALWLASSWWRLRWEPTIEGTRSDRISWRMAHEMSAVGYGFIWPRLVFESDGENIEATCHPSRPATSEPLRYLESFRVSIPSKNFERSVDHFVSLVVARLETVGIRNSELQILWNEIKEEKVDLATVEYRRFEAQLGFEPDEAPESLLNDLIALSSKVGDGAILEVAPACSGEDPMAAFQRIVNLAGVTGPEGKLEVPSSVTRVTRSSEFMEDMPWERGRRLAHAARQAWGLGDSKLPDEAFSEILGISKSNLDYTNDVQEHLPLGLAVRSTKADKWKFIFRRKARTGRRFEAARLLGDRIVAPAEDMWLPTTDAKTVRQKIQRAFAAEFLCPIKSLKYWLQDNYSSESIEEAGEYFGVSPLAIRSHLANHGLIQYTEVG